MLQEMYTVFTPSSTNTHPTLKDALSSVNCYDGVYIRPCVSAGGPSFIPAPPPPLAIPTRTVVEITAPSSDSYECRVTTPNGTRKQIKGKGVEGMVSPSLTILIGMYQVLSITEGTVLFVCTDKMINTMYQRPNEWIDPPPSSKGQYSDTISHILKMMKERKAEVTTLKPKCI
jgi:hypothetical protein